MSFMKTLARRGAPGGAARWAVGMYDESSTRAPNAELHMLIEVFTMVRYRMEALADPSGSAAAILDGMVPMIENEEIRSLAHLVVLILAAETPFAELRPRDRRRFVEVVVEELERGDVPSSVALGADDGMGAVGLAEAFQPSASRLRAFLVERGFDPSV